LNVKNNYDPILTVSNKNTDSYEFVFKNFILFFNEKLAVQENAHNYLNRGIFYSLTGDYNSALIDFNRALTYNDDLTIAYFSRANCQYKMQEQVELLSGNQSLATIPMNENAQFTNDEEKAVSLDYQQILEDYEVTLFLNPNFIFGYYNRAYIKLRLGEYKSAIEDLNRAIQLEPEFAEAYFNRGLTKIFLNDIDGGAMDLSRAGELGIDGAYNIIKRYCN
jgi:tetratricopeptide (TPR) repeat protein